MPDPESWTEFLAALKERQPHPFNGFKPLPVPRPNCPHRVQVCATMRYSHDGKNMFLHRKPPKPDNIEPFHRIDIQTTPWIRETRRAPVQTPLGWSRVMEQPLFWLTDNLVLPAGIAGYVLWRHREIETVWRATDPGGHDAKMPIAVCAGQESTAPALAYLMPFPTGAYPRWSELHDERYDDERDRTAKAALLAPAQLEP